MAAAREAPLELELAGHEVTITNPGKVFFTEVGVTKRELVEYYLAVADGALLGVHDRPMALKRFVDGAAGQAFFQKRAPKSVPEFVRTVELSFPSGRTADEVVVENAAALAWVVNLGCIDLNPHPVRSTDLEHPDELRVDLDPGPGVPWSDVRRVALVVREVLAELGYAAWPKTSGSRGIHVYVRIEPRWAFGDVRRCALALAREVERRAPQIATSKWWKEERHGVFLDYNQNAKDRTVASVYSVRPVPQAWVSAPLTWDEVPDAELGDFTIRTMPGRYARLGDVGAGIDATAAFARPAARPGYPPGGGGPGRRAVAAELREAARRAAAGPAVETAHAGARRARRRPIPARRAAAPARLRRPPHHHPPVAPTGRSPPPAGAARRRRCGSLPRRRRRRRRSPASSGGASGTPRRPRTWARRRCSSTACGAARPSGTGCASTSATWQRPIGRRTRSRTPTTTRGRRSGRLDACERVARSAGSVHSPPRHSVRPQQLRGGPNGADHHCRSSPPHGARLTIQPR